MAKNKGINVVGLVVAIWSALRPVLKAFKANSDKGSKVSQDEAAEIMQAVISAADAYITKHVI